MREKQRKPEVVVLQDQMVSEDKNISRYDKALELVKDVVADSDVCHADTSRRNGKVDLNHLSSK